MDIDLLKALCKVRGINASKLAQMTGVSRQAVSKWFKTPSGSELNMRTTHLKSLTQKLQIKADVLLVPLPVLSDPQSVRLYETTLLWDRLYPNLIEFCVALIRGESQALARLVQVFGIYTAAKIAGQKIWDRFSDYQKYIRPVRRKEIERIWVLHQNLNSS